MCRYKANGNNILHVMKRFFWKQLDDILSNWHIPLLNQVIVLRWTLIWIIIIQELPLSNGIKLLYFMYMYSQICPSISFGLISQKKKIMHWIMIQLKNVALDIYILGTRTSVYSSWMALLWGNGKIVFYRWKPHSGIVVCYSSGNLFTLIC